MKIIRFVALCLLLGCVATPALSGPKKPNSRTERFSATLAVLSGPRSGRVRQVTIYINDYSSDAEAAQLAGAFADGGSRALFKVLTKLKDKGRVAPTGTTGYQVRFIRSTQTPTGRKIVMLTDRPISFLERYYGTRSSDYEYGLVELNINDDGKGEGTLIWAAKVKGISGNQIDVENFGIEPARLLKVRKL